MSGLRLYAAFGVAALLIAAGIGIKVHLSADQRTEAQLETLTDQAAIVVLAVREAADDPEATWETVPGQVTALGENNRRLKDGITLQNARVDEMAREAVRLKAEAAELQAIADRARAQRKAALDRLGDMAATPGTREDCMTLLQEAEAALDLVREAGL